MPSRYVKGNLHVRNNVFASLCGEPHTHNLCVEITNSKAFSPVCDLALMDLFAEEANLTARRFSRFSRKPFDHQVPMTPGRTGGPKTIGRFYGGIKGTILKVTSLVSGSLSIGHNVEGHGVVSPTQITGFQTATGGVGTYYVSPSQSVDTTVMITTDLRFLLLEQFIDWIHENTTNRWSFEVEYAHMSDVNLLFSFESQRDAVHFSLVWR